MNDWVGLDSRIALSLAVIGLMASIQPVRADVDLIGAARNGDARAVAEALENSKAGTDALGRPLFFAAQRGHTEVVAILLEHGADANTSFTFGSPLHAAARADDAAIVSLLLEHGADPDLAAGDFKQSPLHEAADRGSMEAARLLLEHGADVNFRNDRGRPPIHNAVAAGESEMADYLRAEGAAPNLPEPATDLELETADVEAGRIALLGCNTCHEIAPDQPATGPHTGPSLVGIFGAEMASQNGYPYSEPMQSLEGIWNEQALNAFLADPTGVVPGTEMLRVPEMTREQRIGLIVFLRDTAD